MFQVISCNDVIVAVGGDGYGGQSGDGSGGDAGHGGKRGSGDSSGDGGDDSSDYDNSVLYLLLI